jgi:phosphoenolpyruvate-protein phosphotransferase (PTS system enzyme I)
VLRLISRVVQHGRASGAEVSLCGDMASDPAAVDVLLRLGLRRLSVAPAALGRVKLAVSRHGAGDA